MGVNFFETPCTYEDKMSTKKRFYHWTSELQLAWMANPALMGQIVVLKSNDEIFFHPNLVFILLKKFIKTNTQLCSIL